MRCRLCGTPQPSLRRKPCLACIRARWRALRDGRDVSAVEIERRFQAALHAAKQQRRAA